MVQIKNVVARIGDDVEILRDVTRFGLHRRHIVRKRGPVDPTPYKLNLPEGAHDVFSYPYIDKDGDGHLWLCCKE